MGDGADYLSRMSNTYAFCSPAEFAKLTEVQIYGYTSRRLDVVRENASVVAIENAKALAPIFATILFGKPSGAASKRSR